MDYSTHPVLKHPLGFLFYFVSIIFLLDNQILETFIITNSDQIRGVGPVEGVMICLFFLNLLTGSFLSFIYYVNYYLKEKKWKKKVIEDLRSDKLRYNSYECFWGRPKR